MSEEIRGVTWDLWGSRLAPWQAAQRLFRAGFTDAKVLATMWAVLEGESGRYLRAWHHNVLRDADGNIWRDDEGKFLCKSTDLGFIQRNVVHDPVRRLSDQEAPEFAEELFAKHPNLALGDSSAIVAFALYQDRGFQPWYAFSNGGYKKHLPAACAAVGNFLAVAFGFGGNLVRLA